MIDILKNETKLPLRWVIAIALILSYFIPIAILASASREARHQDITAFSNILDEDYLDSFLLELDIPAYVLETMPLGQKNMMYNVLRNEQDVEFAFSLEEEYPIDDLSFRVSGMRMDDGTYYIFPSFIWHRSVSVINDRFGASLNTNYWSVAPGTTQLNLWLHGPGQSHQHLIGTAWTMSWAGPIFAMPTGTSQPTGWWYEGHGVFRARPSISNPPYNIVLSYAHDNTWSNNLSIDINAGVFSLSFTTTGRGGGLLQRSQTLVWRN